MRNFILIIIPSLLITPFPLIANEIFSVEIKALTLVMEKYNEELEGLGNIQDIKPNYMAFKHDECNATVKITEKNGLQITTKESFDVNVCKKQISKTIKN